MHVLAFEYRNEIITVVWPAGRNWTDSASEVAVAVGGGHKVAHEGLKMLSMDGHRRHSDVLQLKTEDVPEYTERTLCVAEVIRWDN